MNSVKKPTKLVIFFVKNSEPPECEPAMIKSKRKCVVAFPLGMCVISRMGEGW